MMVMMIVPGGTVGLAARAVCGGVIVLVMVMIVLGGTGPAARAIASPGLDAAGAVPAQPRDLTALRIHPGDLPREYETVTPQA